MKYSRTTIQDAIVITPEVFADSRGIFLKALIIGIFKVLLIER